MMSNFHFFLNFQQLIIQDVYAATLTLKLLFMPSGLAPLDYLGLILHHLKQP